MKKLQRTKPIVTIKNVKILPQCDGFFRHHHRFKFTADLCTFFQIILLVEYIYYAYLRKFKPDKLRKIELAMKGSNLRAMRHRVKKGLKAI